jgi:hypothetical protein
LDKALDQIQYGDIAKSHWYFMGVAGDSYLMFLNLKLSALEQFDTRFGTLDVPLC